MFTSGLDRWYLVQFVISIPTTVRYCLFDIIVDRFVPWRELPSRVDSPIEVTMCPFQVTRLLFDWFRVLFPVWQEHGCNWLIHPDMKIVCIRSYIKHWDFYLPLNRYQSLCPWHKCDWFPKDFISYFSQVYYLLSFLIFSRDIPHENDVTDVGNQMATFPLKQSHRVTRTQELEMHLVSMISLIYGHFQVHQYFT